MRLSKKKPEITFHLDSNHSNLLLAPSSAKSLLPDQWKNMPKHVPSGSTQAVDFSTQRACIPFFDAMTSGYLVRSFCDITFTVSEHALDYKYRGPLNPVEQIDEPMVYNYSPYWIARLEFPMFVTTSKDVSLQIDAVKGRFDKWQAVSGVVDTDLFPLQIKIFLAFPFVGEVNIKRGDPIAQLTPFVRTEFRSKTITEDTNPIFQRSIVYSTEYSGYRRRVWQRKKFS